MTASRLKLDLAARIAEAAPGWTPVVPSSVVAELDGLGRRRDAAGARALARRFAVMRSRGRGDAAIIEAATAAPRRAVLTNDRALRKTLRAAGVAVLFVRGRRSIEVDGSL